MPDQTPYRILTTRLLLRCWELSDAPALGEKLIYNLEHLRPWMPWSTEENAEVETQYQRLRSVRARFDTDQEYGYGIFDRSGQEILGSAGLHRRVGDAALEIGYWIDKDHTRQGLTTEASAALTQAAFEIFKVGRVEIHCDPRNEASAGVARKLGYTLEATLRQRLLDYYGTSSDSMIWSMLKDEYPTSPAASLGIEAYDGAGRRISLD
jgi:RimJ/RimL family protein N-acetyltransferase